MSQGEEVEYDDVIDRTMNNVEAGGGITLSITLDHLQDPLSIGFQVTVLSAIAGLIISILNCDV